MMQKVAREIALSAGKPFPLEWMLRFSPAVLLPFYHVVSDEPLPHIRNYRIFRVSEFKRDLELLLKYYKPVALSDLICRESRDRKMFHLSFDDGLRQCYELIAPILISKGIPATFFINPGFVNNRRLFHRYKAGLLYTHLEKYPDSLAIFRQEGLSPHEILKITLDDAPLLDRIAEKAEISFDTFLLNYQPYMTLQQIRELSDSGFTIGGHSWDHPEFWLLPEDEQYGHIQRSMQWIDANCPQALNAFAFPFTDDQISGGLLDKVFRNGMCDLTFGTAGLKRDVCAQHLQRLPCETGLPLEVTLKGELLYSLFRKVAGKSIVTRS
jgi:peptidoglycan/xylan/chitin deacetylase (PgdA/CDA1 family)